MSLYHNYEHALNIKCGNRKKPQTFGVNKLNQSSQQVAIIVATTTSSCESCFSKLVA